MEFNRNSYVNTKRDSWVEINLDNLEFNAKNIKQLLPSDTKLFGVVKADAYGHGAVMCANSLAKSGVEYFGVASIDEGIQLREAKINLPILVLGTVPVWAFDVAAANNLTISLYSEAHIEAAKIAFEKNGLVSNVHIKIDTGMNRIGVAPSCAVSLIKKVKNEKAINLTGIFTHLACAEDENITNRQISLFNSIISQVDTKNLLIHTNNSAGIICRLNKNITNMSRAGIILYGLMTDIPKSYNLPSNFEIKPVMSLKTRIVNIHTAEKNQGVSYSYTYKAQKQIKIATVPLGYADGISRNLSNKIFAGLHGQKIKQIGNITMDQMMFDISDIPNVKEGDTITLIGQDGENVFSLNEWAKILNTIHYELACRLKVRLTKIYTRN